MDNFSTKQGASQTLTEEEMVSINGGFVQAIAIGYALRAGWELLERPEKVWEGVVDCFE